MKPAIALALLWVGSSVVSFAAMNATSWHEFGCSHRRSYYAENLFESAIPIVGVFMAAIISGGYENGFDLRPHANKEDCPQ